VDSRSRRKGKQREEGHEQRIWLIYIRKYKRVDRTVLCVKKLTELQDLLLYWHIPAEENMDQNLINLCSKLDKQHIWWLTRESNTNRRPTCLTLHRKSISIPHSLKPCWSFSRGWSMTCCITHIAMEEDGAHFEQFTTCFPT
jgi:hypothetical protein